MEKTYSYQTHGTCSRRINLTMEGDMIRSVTFEGGCSVNTQGVSALVRGMKAEDAIARLKGIRCGMRPTSCPDQLAHALEGYLAEQD